MLAIRQPVLLFLLATAFAVASSCTQNGEKPPFLEATVDTTLVIGDEEENGIEYALAQPEAVAVDSTGRVYVADNQIPAIQVYDATGRHLRTIGREGRGPGEFHEIGELAVHGDTLTVVDRAGIDQFSLGGASIASYQIESGGYTPRGLLRHPGGKWILGWHQRRGGADSLLHVYTRGFESTEMAFVRGTRYTDDNVASRSTLTFKFGSIGVNEDGHVLFAPYLYEGEIGQYAVVDGSWTQTGTLTGYTERSAYEYEKVSSDAPRTMEAQVHTSSKGSFNVMYYNKSLGLFRRGDHIFHFTSIAREDRRLFGVEIYDSEGELKGYAPLKQVATDENDVPTEATPMPEAIGPNGAFYLIEKGYDAVPKVTVLTIRVDEIY